MSPEQLPVVAITIRDICNISTCRCGSCVRIAALNAAGPIVGHRSILLAAPRGVKVPSAQDEAVRDE